MAATRWQTLALVAVATGCIGWLVLRVVANQGGVLPTVPWTVSVVILALAAVVFWLGWHVRQYLKGDRPSLDPIRAARTAVLAKASAFAGALLVGWYGAQSLALTLEAANEPMREAAVAAGVATVSAVVLAVVGLVVERFCRLPPPGSQDEVEPDGEPSAA